MKLANSVLNLFEKKRYQVHTKSGKLFLELDANSLKDAQDKVDAMVDKDRGLNKLELTVTDTETGTTMAIRVRPIKSAHSNLEAMTDDEKVKVDKLKEKYKELEDSLKDAELLVKQINTGEKIPMHQSDSKIKAAKEKAKRAGITPKFTNLDSKAAKEKVSRIKSEMSDINTRILQLAANSGKREL